MNYMEIPFRQQIFILIIGGFLLFTIIELVRQRKMLEQYSIIWVFIGILSISYIWLYPIIRWLTVVIGAGFTVSTTLFIAIFILLLLNLQLYIKLTEYSHIIKDLIQHQTIMQNELQEADLRLDQVAKKADELSKIEE